MDGSSNAGRVAWSLVDGAKTTDLPDGDSILSYRKLREKFAPQSALSYVRLNKMFIKSKLKSVTNDSKIFLTDPEMIVICMEMYTTARRSNQSDTNIILQVIT